MELGFDIHGSLDLDKIKRVLGPSTDVLTGYTNQQPHAKKVWNEDQLKILQRHAPAWINTRQYNMPELARKNTYGDQNTPARPFLEEGINEQKDAIGQAVAPFFAAKVEGGDVTNPLKVIGALCVGAVKEFILSAYYKGVKPNSWLTIAVKSRSQKRRVLTSDQPLVDTGEMMNATTYVIMKGS